jgi:thioredoxin-like negative regulator of GroEL
MSQIPQVPQNKQKTQSKQIIEKFANRNEFMNLLKVNPGLVILKLGATWCAPCKQIKPVMDAFFASSPPEVICADVDVDESFDLYALLKKMRMVNGIPAVLCYKKGNTTYVPNDMVAGTDPARLNAFFVRCGKLLVS